MAEGPWTEYAKPQEDGPWAEYVRLSESKKEPRAKTPAEWAAMVKEHNDLDATKIGYKMGEGATDIASRFLPAPVAAGVGYLTNVATQAIPAFFGGAVGQAAKQPVANLATSLMQSAVKPTLAAQESGDAARAIKTLLQEGHNPTMGGVNAMGAKIGQLDSQVKSILANSQADVNKFDVSSRLSDLMRRYRGQVNPEGDTAAVARSWDEFLRNTKTNIPVAEANQLKSGTYKALGDKAYGELQGASIEAQKQLARGLKEEIAAVEPSVSPLLSREGDLINARDIALRRALMSGNRNPFSLAPLANGPAGFIGFMADKSDLVKSLLARGLYSGLAPSLPYLGMATGGLLGSQMGAPPGVLYSQQY